MLLSRFEDQKYKEKEAFSMKRVKKALFGIYKLLAPWLLSLQKLNAIYDWHNKFVTACLANLYFIIWYYDLVLSFFIGWIVISLLLIRVDMYIDDHQVSQHQGLPWKKWMVQQVTPFDYQVFVEQHGPLIQKLIFDIADYLERFKNLMSWKKPVHTTVIIIGMMLATMTPIQLIVKLALFYMGIEFFVLHALRCHYPKYRRLFNVLEWILLDIPADHCYHHYSNYNNNNNSNKEMLIRSTAATVSVREPSVDKTLTTTTIKAAAASTSDTKSAMVFLASANLTHKLLHSDSSKKKKALQTKEMEKLLKTNDPNVFGCIYKDKPGFLRLEEGNGFVFMSNQKRLVAVAWNDVVNVIKKSKKGVCVSIKDGVLLIFDPVVNRDDCVRQMLKNMT